MTTRFGTMSTTRADDVSQHTVLPRYKERRGAAALAVLLSTVVAIAGFGAVPSPAFAQTAVVKTVASQNVSSVTPLSEAHSVSDAALIEQGRLLAVAADCMACHTATGKKGAQAFAGGYGIVSPMGTIYSTNITPSKSAGIGRYTEAQFAAALREGIRADGAHLYPAMPYTSYNAMTDSDLHALYTYFMQGVPAIDVTGPVTALPFPFNIRASMAAWNVMFLKDHRFVADRSKSAEWNRGAYLTNVLGHCDACHTPRNVAMAEDDSQAFGGAQLGAWYAPNITSDPISGIGGWSNQEIVDYLRSGHVAGKNQAAGGMAEAVQNSLQFLPQADLNAIAVFLKSSRPIRNPLDHRPAYAYGLAQGDNLEPALRGVDAQNARDSVHSGAALYSANCASCHGVDGKGSANQTYPSLINNTATGASNPSNLLAAILHGVDRKVGDDHRLMPSFGEDSFVQPLTDVQIAAVSNYVLKSFGNPDVSVSVADVATARQGGQLPFLAWVQPYILATLVIVVMAILLLAALGLTARRRSIKGTSK